MTSTPTATFRRRPHSTGDLDALERAQQQTRAEEVAAYNEWAEAVKAVDDAIAADATPEAVAEFRQLARRARRRMRYRGMRDDAARAALQQARWRVDLYEAELAEQQEVAA